MDLAQLRCFVALAENENLTQVAHQLELSPSSLSRNIAKLESELGAKLFDRINRKIVLNSAGRLFLEYVRNGLGEIDHGVSMLRRSETISLVTDTPEAWDTILGDYISAFPNARISNRVLSANLITQEMLLTDYDFWLSGCEVQTPTDRLNFSLIGSDKLYLAVPASHPLAARKSVSLLELRDEVFLFPWTTHRSYNLYLKICKRAGFTPKIHSNSNFLMRMKLVAAGRGISFMDDDSRMNDLFKNIAFLDIEDAPKLQPVTLYWHKDRVLSAAATAFWENIAMYC